MSIFSGNNEFSGLSDSQLDAAYGQAVDNGQSATAARFGLEINSRQASVGSFLLGAVGVNRFPIYAAKSSSQFSTTSAQGDITKSAAAVADKVTFSAKAILITALIIGLAVVTFKVKK